MMCTMINKVKGFPVHVVHVYVVTVSLYVVTVSLYVVTVSLYVVTVSLYSFLTSHWTYFSRQPRVPTTLQLSVPMKRQNVGRTDGLGALGTREISWPRLEWSHNLSAVWSLCRCPLTSRSVLMTVSFSSFSFCSGRPLVVPALPPSDGHILRCPGRVLHVDQWGPHVLHARHRHYSIIVALQTL